MKEGKLTILLSLLNGLEVHGKQQLENLYTCIIIVEEAIGGKKETEA